MRDIKFRAWDKKRKRIYEVIHLMRSTFEGIWCIGKGRNIIEDKEIHIDIQPDKCEVMQFTGLKDSHGKEIYEGDIVSDHIGVGVIEYVEKYAAFRINYQNMECKWFYDYTLDGERESIEVIGNIYENPELIREDIICVDQAQEQ